MLWGLGMEKVAGGIRPVLGVVLERGGVQADFYDRPSVSERYAARG